ncbi:bacteriohemerythrin [Insolitispirillum peregrinum]|uniref:Methyl-accepting chemotaxis protein/hemerythrin n=1 Tax=Insolitispirillum peregrinum TaxID=80876 RepID=A0A1N7L423_9PROT|nr:bacteriohemerythrin [Insolitispirillum peregrinum]SIS68516.1 methyl-accepting chemotaxis protein/hemerythrin [Insolitispirillum peregrinum]
MPLLVWRDQLSVGAPEIDKDHKQLIEFVNQLNDAVTEAQSEKVVGKILLELIEYTRDHFSREEKVMAAAGYPDLDRHRKIHLALTNKVLTFAQSYLRTPTDQVKRELIDFLASWLIEHIIKEDRKLGAYLQNKRIWL